MAFTQNPKKPNLVPCQNEFIKVKKQLNAEDSTYIKNGKILTEKDLSCYFT